MDADQRVPHAHIMIPEEGVSAPSGEKVRGKDTTVPAERGNAALEILDPPDLLLFLDIIDVDLLV